MDEVIRRKLLADGDGAGDDRRIALVAKMFTKWSRSDLESDTAKAQLRKIEASLLQCEQALQKAALVRKMNFNELNNYEVKSANIDQEISVAHSQIDQCKRELDDAKQVRRHRQEYDALANIIKQHPKRQTTLAKIELVRKRITENRKRKTDLERTLALRKNQFSTLMTILHELKDDLEVEPKQLDEDACSSETSTDNATEPPMEIGISESTATTNALNNT